MIRVIIIYTNNRDTLIRFVWTALLSPNLQISSYLINPKPDDILIIGGLLKGNETAIGCMTANKCATDWHDVFYSTFYGANIEHFMGMLLPNIVSTFPGLIIWHSYSYLHTKYERASKPHHISMIELIIVEN